MNFCAKQPQTSIEREWIYFMYYESDVGRLQHECNRLRLLATCSITITTKQNHNVIDYD